MKGLILVTGGTGYIGSHTAVELINEGYEVVIVDNLSNSSADSLEGIREITGVRPVFERIDLCDKPLLEGFFEKAPVICTVFDFIDHSANGRISHFVARQ